MKRRWRGALIGCGFFSPNHLNAWRDLADQAEIVALCDLEIEKAKELAGRFGIARVYDDAQAMLAAEDLDFIDVVTTAATHRPLVELGARHGVMAICQKPFAERIEDADAIVAAARAAGTPVLVHENFRWQHPFREIAKRVGRGEIGELRTLSLVFRHSYDIYSGQPYLAKADRLALMDVGLHLFDLARFLAGDVDRVHCETFHLNPAVRGEDAFAARIGHRNGVVTTIDCSFYSQAPEDADAFPQTRAVLEGSQGRLTLETGYRLKLVRSGVEQTSVVEPSVPSWGEKPWHVIQESVRQLQSHALEILAGRASPQPSGAHNRDTLALVLAAYDSAARNETIEMAVGEARS